MPLLLEPDPKTIPDLLDRFIDDLTPFYKDIIKNTLGRRDRPKLGEIMERYGISKETLDEERQTALDILRWKFEQVGVFGLGDD